MRIEEGSRVSHYKIVSSIGKGGMGEVYLAEDIELDRRVAVKFLSEDLSKDSEKVNRFIQEAKAASALNHPSILTVYEIGTWEETRYIATEYIEGKTLREIIRRKRSMPLNRVLKVGIQVAEALAAAHRAGIAHRDIKPENIMVREDGYVKVLDFGLAKLTEKKSDRDISLEGETKALVKTNPGVVMGTVSYMSPEQARGKETDERTDVWSLGVVLYEMLSGKVPFSGETTNHTIVAILETEPKLLENVPDELQRIVRKTLTKDKAMRYQNTGDLVIDLKNLRRDLDIQGELERSVIPNTGTESAAGSTAISGAQSSNAIQAETQEPPEGGTTSVSQNFTSTSSLEYAVIQAKTHKLATAVIAAVLIGAVAVVSYLAFFSGSSGQISSIAVMPFLNESGKADLEYLSDGMTETLINDLSEIPDLKVKARNSVFRYKGKDLNLSAIADELGVQAVLLGRLVQRDGRLSLSLELIDASTENILWGNKYENSMTELSDLQSRIARDVAGKLATRLAGKDGGSSNSENSEAYHAYLKGRFHWRARTLVGFERAIAFFEEAIEFDPGYASAWSGLADSYLLLPEYGDYRADEYLPKAKKAAEKALELDPESAEAHTSLAYIYYSFEWDFKKSEELFKRAISLDPEYATAYQWYAELLINLNRTTESEANAKKAVELDPLSPIMGKILGSVLTLKGDLPAGEAQLKRTLELENNFGPALEALTQNYALQKRVDEALATCDRFERNGRELKDDCKGVVYACAGDKEKAEEFLSGYRFSGAGKTYNVALINASIGRADEAFRLFEELYKERHVFLLNLGIEPCIDGIRGDPRYGEFLKKLGLPERVLSTER